MTSQQSEVDAREPLSLIVAVAKNGVIGSDGQMPWHFPEDLKYFKRMTLDHAVIMGRKTFESIGRPLPKRRNIVLSRSATRFSGVEMASSFEDALKLARTTDPAPFVIGGAAVYALALPVATRVLVTEVDQAVPGDVRFEPLDSAEWVEVSRTPAETPRLTFVIYERSSMARDSSGHADSSKPKSE